MFDMSYVVTQVGLEELITSPFDSTATSLGTGQQLKKRAAREMQKEKRSPVN